MSLRNLFACFVSILLTLLALCFCLYFVMAALVIEQFPPGFSRDIAWKWMMGELPPDYGAPSIPSGGREHPAISGGGNFAVTQARQLSPEESHLNIGRVHGFVRDEFGQPLGGVPVRVDWCCGAMDTVTSPEGWYEFILGPGEYNVFVNTGESQRAHFRTDLPEFFGHYTYEVDFQQQGERR